MFYNMMIQCQTDKGTINYKNIALNMLKSFGFTVNMLVYTNLFKG